MSTASELAVMAAAARQRRVVEADVAAAKESRSDMIERAVNVTCQQVVDAIRNAAERGEFAYTIIHLTDASGDEWCADDQLFSMYDTIIKATIREACSCTVSLYAWLFVGCTHCNQRESTHKQEVENLIDATATNPKVRTTWVELLQRHLGIADLDYEWTCNDHDVTLVAKW